MKYILLGSTFIAVILTVLSLYVVLFAESSLIKERLKLPIGVRPDDSGKTGRRTRTIQRGDSFLSSLSRIGVINKIFEKNKDSLTKAHIPIRPEELFGISLLVAGFLGLGLYVTGMSLFIIAPVVFVSYRIPSIYVSLVKRGRAKRLNNQLPEALSILSNGLRAGLSFIQSMLIAGKELEEPISEEFNKIVRDNSLGKPLDEALSDFSKRTEDEDVDIFVTAILIQRQVGGNLSEILDILASTIRDRIKLKGDIKTITAQSKLSAVVIGGIPLFIIIILSFISPDFINPLFTTFAGNLMLVVIVVLQLMGVAVLAKILQIKM